MELSETCRVSCQNKFVKLVYLVGFIIKKYYNGLGVLSWLSTGDKIKNSTVHINLKSSMLSWR
jgi:hypothetical protein